MHDHPYMPLFWGDLLKQTAFWSGEERALLIVLWATEWWNGPLPLDLARLAKGIDYDEQTFLRLWNLRLHALFVETPEGYQHPELEARRRAVAQISGARRSAGKASGEARRARASVRSAEQAAAPLLEQIVEHPVQTKARTNGRSHAQAPIQSNPIQSNPSQESPHAEARSADPANKPPVPPSGADPPPPATADADSGQGRVPTRRRRMPADHPTESLRAWAAEHTPSVNFDAELAQLRDHEFRDPHSDWDAVARNWLRRAAKEKSRASGGERLTRFEQHKRRLYGEPQG
jgi:uncharacterized protein YdaU (DUF1376 family)